MKKIYTLASSGILCQAISLNCLAGGIVLDSSINPDNAGQTLTPVNNVTTIDATIGKGVGGNLYHSFQDFNVASGQAAEFTDSTASNYNNVIARVTGNTRSEIFGEVRTGAGLENANLYLINPAGILFGAGASVNIGGAFYASTADYIVYNDDPNHILQMDVNGVNFSSEPIAAFGFTDVSNSTSVDIVDTTLRFNDHDSGIYADNINVNNGGIEASNAALSLIATAGDNARYAIQDKSLLADAGAGNVSLDSASITLNGNQNIVLRGGQLTLSNASSINLSSSDPITGPTQAAIDLGASHDIVIDHSSIASSVVAGNAGGVYLYADPKQGNISLDASTISANGDHQIAISADNLKLANASNITLTSTGVVAASTPASIDLDLSHGLDVDGSLILSTTASGISGDININADEISITNLGRIVNGETGTVRASVSSGDINIHANNLSIIGQTRDQAAADGSSAAPEITGIAVTAGRRPNANSGAINIVADDIYMAQTASIKSTNYGATPGEINIEQASNNGRLVMRSGALISYETLGASSSPSHGSNINIRFSQVSLAGADSYTGSDPNYTVSPSLTEIKNFNNGSVENGGDIRIEASNFSLSDSAKISAKSTNTGSGGNVYIDADKITIAGADENYQHFIEQGDYHFPIGAGIAIAHTGTSDSTTTESGNVVLNANSIDIGRNGYISVSDDGGGEYSIAGNISLNANHIRLTDAIISSSNYLLNSAPTSNININATESLYVNNSEITTNLVSPDGFSGNINIFADQLAIVHSQINTSANLGNGGNITINANYGIISSDTLIDAHSVKSVSGDISISDSIQQGSLSPLSIVSEKSDSIVLTDLCSVDNDEQSSLSMINNNRPLKFEQQENIIFRSHTDLISVNDCLRPAFKVSLL